MNYREKTYDISKDFESFVSKITSSQNPSSEDYEIEENLKSEIKNWVANSMPLLKLAQDSEDTFSKKKAHFLEEHLRFLSMVVEGSSKKELIDEVLMHIQEEEEEHQRILELDQSVEILSPLYEGFTVGSLIGKK